MAPTLRLPKGASILVTGASGYIATQTIDVLLSAGYNVVGTTRSPKDWLDAHFTDKFGAGRYKSAIVPDLEADDALEPVMAGIAGVVHLATDLALGTDARALVDTVVKQTVGALKVASRHEEVKSFVLVSSSSAAYIPTPNTEGVVLGQDSWNDAAVAAAFSDQTPAEVMFLFAYAASKTEGERAAWKWVKENKPGFAFSTVLPNYNIGEILAPDKIAGSTMGWIRDYVKGTPKLPLTELIPPQWFIDVRDDARLITVALLDASVEGLRLFGYAAPFNWTQVFGILRKLRPGNDKLPADPVNEGRDLTDVSAESKRSEDLIKSFFGVDGWTSLEDSLRAGIQDL